MADRELSADPSDRAESWPMGAVARRTGIGEHTLRTWERRFGFPTPERLPSGHRRFTSEQVRHLILIARALGHGCRAGDVVPLPPERLKALIRECENREQQAPEVAGRQWMGDVLAAAESFDVSVIGALLRAEVMHLGVYRFFRERLEPLLEQIKAARTRGELAIRYEQLISEQVQDFLRSQRLALETGARGPAVVMATCCGESDRLGVQLAALVVAVSGKTVRLLGEQVPVDEIAAAAAGAVAVWVGTSADSARAESLVHDLRSRLPKGIALWVGGNGAVDLELPAGVDGLPTLDALSAALVDIS